MDEQALEQLIREKGLNAPRVTPEDIDEAIIKEEFYIFPGTSVTVCLLTLKNGFSTVGSSACASPLNFDAEIGKRIARFNAREKIWPLEGYLLKQRIMNLHDDSVIE